MIRVIRILEYTFKTQEVAEAHFSMRGLGVPLNGTVTHGSVTIRSAAVFDLSNEGLDND